MLFRWLTLFNVLAGLALVLGVVVAPLLAPDFFSESRSVEVRLVPVEPRPKTAAAEITASPHPEAAAEFRTPDLSARPWDLLPDGSVRFRE